MTIRKCSVGIAGPDPVIDYTTFAAIIAAGLENGH
jgi:hypothetical protein